MDEVWANYGPEAIYRMAWQTALIQAIECEENVLILSDDMTAFFNPVFTVLQVFFQRRAKYCGT